MWMKVSLFLCFRFICEALERRPTVKISQGLVVGIKVYADSGRILDAYLGLPYAAPPVDNLRFAAPQRHEGWNGSFYASDYGPSCPQLPLKEKINESENCLFLNIWAPETTVRYPLPVVIFIDGDEFAKGNRLSVSGQDLAIEGVVVVTLNYRLNVFGFLCFETQEVRGNMGLLDQYFALLWVRSNIRAFGGDSDKITLYGHSAGAASVALHMTSPRTAGYFQRVIISSGSVVSPWHVTNNAKTASLEVAKLLGCLNGTFSKILACLRSKSTKDLLTAFEIYNSYNNSTSYLLPVIDTFLLENDRYLPITPERAFKTGTSMQVPILTGISRPLGCTNEEEWSKIAHRGYSQLEKFIELHEIPDIMTRYNLNTRNNDQILDLIKWKYIESSNGNSKALMDQLKNLIFESKTEAPHFLQLQLLLSSYVQPVYTYYLQNPEFVINSTDSCLSVDLLLVFGPLLLNQIARRRFNNAEMRFSQYTKQLWKNFIIFGNPSPGNQLKSWHTYNSMENHIEYLDIEMQSTKHESTIRNERIYFWNRLLPKFAQFNNDDTNSFLRDLRTIYAPESGYKHAMYTLLALVIALLALLIICVIVIKKRAKEREREFQMVY